MLDTTYMTKELLTAILKTIDEGIHAVDMYGRTIFYNEVAAEHDGMTIEEVIGKPLLTVFPSLNENLSTLLKVIKTKEPIYHETQIYRNIYGKQIETMNTTLPIILNGEVMGAVEIAKDYTKVKALSEQLIQLQSMMNPPSAKKKKENNGVQYSLQDLITENEEFKQLKGKAKKLALSDSSILVYGESGTGKELFVQGIHQASKRREGPFIAQNCAALPESLLESILFGTAKGSYTGAVDRQGLFELAHEGTLFLDELHTIPIQLQAKLLRVLEDGYVRRIGSTKAVKVDVRVIAAMNVQPNQLLQQKKIREDLFYRLNVLHFELIPLRKRPEDIILLMKHFINIYNRQLSKRISHCTKELEALFLQYSWPGNVRELKHTIEYMMNICDSKILTYQHLPDLLKKAMNKEQDGKSIAYSKSATTNLPISMTDYLAKIESDMIEQALKETAGNVYKAAQLLMIPRQTLQYKMKKFNITAEN